MRGSVRIIPIHTEKDRERKGEREQDIYKHSPHHISKSIFPYQHEHQSIRITNTPPQPPNFSSGGGEAKQEHNQVENKLICVSSWSILVNSRPQTNYSVNWQSPVVPITPLPIITGWKQRLLVEDLLSAFADYE